MNSKLERLIAAARRPGEKSIAQSRADGTLSAFSAEVAAAVDSLMLTLKAEFEQRGVEADDGAIDWEKVEAFADRNLGGADRFDALPIPEALRRIDFYSDEKEAGLRQIARYVLELRGSGRPKNPRVERIRAAAARAYDKAAKQDKAAKRDGAAGLVAAACYLLDLDRAAFPEVWKERYGATSWKSALEAKPGTVRKWFSANISADS